TADDNLAGTLEPGATSPSARFEAMRKLAKAGILTGVTMMPILPFLEDDLENIRQIVRTAADCGASYIIPAFGMTLRSGSREYYYQELDHLDPGVKEKYLQAFGDSYQCSAPNWRQLDEVFQEEISNGNIRLKIPVFAPE
ncbi:MAG: radical SAM protein, partial [Bacteroidetes bacterium]